MQCEAVNNLRSKASHLRAQLSDSHERGQTLVPGHWCSTCGTRCPMSNHCGAPHSSGYQLCHLRTLSKKCSCLIRPKKKCKRCACLLKCQKYYCVFYFYTCVCVCTYVCLVRDTPRPLDDKQTPLVLAPLPRTSSTSLEIAGGEHGVLSPFAVSHSA